MINNTCQSDLTSSNCFLKIHISADMNSGIGTFVKERRHFLGSIYRVVNVGNTHNFFFFDNNIEPLVFLVVHQAD